MLELKTAVLWIRHYSRGVPAPMGPESNDRSQGNLWWRYDLGTHSHSQRPAESGASFIQRLQKRLEGQYPKDTLQQYDWSFRDAATGEELTMLYRKAERWVVP